MSTATLAFIVGNRDFFPASLIIEGRRDILALFKEMDITPVILDETDAKLGAVETYAHAKRCAEVFRQHREAIDGILVVLPNFGDERGIADTIKLSGLNVPILVQAYRPGRLELIIGGRTDPQFGPVVMLGMGGIYTEVLRDISIRICPLDVREARSMIRSLKSYPILAGARGRKPVDEEALVRILMRVSRLMEKEKPKELDLNPVLVRDDGLWAADVRVIK